MTEELCQCGFGEEYFTLEGDKSICTVCGGTVTVPGDAPPAEGPDASRKTILIVDDQAFFRKRIREALLDRGYVVLEAGQGLEAVSHFARSLEAPSGEPSRRVDLVVLDLVMPGLIDGFQTLGVLKAMDEKIPVLVLTASPPTPDLLQKLGHLKAKKYLNKASGSLEALLLKNIESL